MGSLSRDILFTQSKLQFGDSASGLMFKDFRVSELSSTTLYNDM